ncbi:MAG: TolC family protein, partial [Pseudomonadota bacterium]
MFKRLSTAITGVALICAGLGAPTQATTLADALALAYKTNPSLRAQQAALRAADEGVIAARSNLLPALSQTITYGRTVNYNQASNVTIPAIGRNP